MSLDLSINPDGDRIGEILTDLHSISHDAIREGLRTQRSCPDLRLGWVLLYLGHVTQWQLLAALDRQERLRMHGKTSPLPVAVKA